MRRLYLQIYVAFVASLILFTLLVWGAFVLLPHEHGEYDRFVGGLAAVLGDRLPPADRPAQEVQAALEALAQHLPTDLAVHTSDGRRVAALGAGLPAPDPGATSSHWIHRGRGRSAPTVAFRLPDGRWLVVRDRMSHRPPAYAWLWGFGALGIAIGIGAFPVVRRITGRLERLQKRVDALGAGDLGTRVEVEGEDEVARLAQSFNRAADRIERLVNAQRRTLASASHELRTPLARLRMALELLAAESRPDLLERATRDIEELDELIGELLLASKLDALDRLEREEQVDLLALVAEEAVRVDAEVAGPPTEVRGDPRLLRRLVRNLLDNARRYGAGSAIEVELEPVANGVCLRVSDRGPGVPESERERIFEPFYRPLQPDGPEGFGLGLALVRQIARHHGGDARCLPREGGGSVLEVRLGGRV